MKRLLALVVLFTLAVPLLADQLTQAVQQRLKEQGFYYGPVDGQSGEETAAAIRRYQIRFGLRVTGQLNDETLRSLGLNGRSSSPAPTPLPAPQQPDYGRPPMNQDRRTPPEGVTPEAREFSEVDPYNPYIDPEIPRDRQYDSYRGSGASSLESLFAGSVYQFEPGELQQDVLMAVQGELARRGLYSAAIDGEPGPATSRAIGRFQSAHRLPVTGKLDNDTLDELDALPGERFGPPEQFSERPRTPRRIYRGIWVE
jgi:peptidoglycan hydrolase-like protein with peptidoglycan-binding domain